MDHKEESKLLEVYRDPWSYYKTLDVRHKVYFQMWLRSDDETVQERLLPFAFPGLFMEQPVHRLQIVTSPGAQQFAFVVG